MYIKYTISFALFSRPSKVVIKNGKEIVPYAIRMRVSYRGQRIDFFAGYSTEKDKWNEDAGRMQRNATDATGHPASVVNAYLAKMEATVESCFKAYELEECVPSADRFRDDFNIKMMGAAKGVRHGVDSFKVAFDRFLEESGEKQNWTEATFEKFDALWHDMNGCFKNVGFNNFDERGLISFVSYLRDTKNLKNSTIEKKLGFLRWFLRWAEDNGCHAVHDYAKFHPKFKKTQNRVVFLNQEELAILKNLVLPPDMAYLQKVLDVFLFCCFTGLRHSDAKNLKKKDIKGNRIELTTIKTADTLSIDLNDTAKAILDKYRDVDLKDDAALPVISNQKMNEYLKILAQFAGIDSPVKKVYYKGNERIEETRPKYECIGTHTGRRTFICQALSLGIPVNIVMSWTGHADYADMRPYIDVVDEIKAQEMNKMNNL